MEDNEQINLLTEINKIKYMFVRRVFFRFLKDNKIYSKFIKRFRLKDKSLFMRQDIECFLGYYSPEDYIYIGINWTFSAEGFEYWEFINNKWVGYLEENGFGRGRFYGDKKAFSKIS